MRVIIVLKGHEFLLDVGAQERVIDIKRQIEYSLGIPVASQNLSVLGWELIDGLDMEDYPIVSEGTKIYVATKHIHFIPMETHRKIHVIVKFASKQITIEVDKTETVRSLKEKIHIMEGTPIKRISLFFSGREMEEDFRNVSEYGICDFSEIIVFLKTMTRLREDPPCRRLDVVVQTASTLFNAACIPVTEIKDSTTTSDLRQMLLSQKILPMDDYLFIHKQRIMREDCSIRWHGVENGDFIYVFKGTVSRAGF